MKRKKEKFGVRTASLAGLAFVAVVCAGCRGPAGESADAAADGTVTQNEPRAEILWERTICREKGKYVGWPSVTQLKNGDVIAVFSGDRAEHVSPDGKVEAVISRDGGETWSAPATVADTPLDDRDAGVVQLPNGDVVVTWFTQVCDDPKFGPPPPEAVCRKWIGILRAVSKDSGRTWSAPEVIPLKGSAPHGPVVTRDGALVNVGRTCADPMREWLRPLEKNPSGDGLQRSIITCERSADGAKTWETLCADIPDTKGENAKTSAFWEPSVTEYAPGKLFALVRYHGPAGFDGKECLRATRSEDGGRTWSPMTRVPLCTGWTAPHVMTLADGRLLCTVGRRQGVGGNGEWAYVSDDAGETWHDGLQLSNADGLCGPCDLGYPCTVQLKDGSLLSVFYQVEASGEKPCLRAVKWRLKPAEPLVVLARGTATKYEGHPTTVTCADGRILAVWCTPHGGWCGPAAETKDGGRTWTRIDDRFPKGYAQHINCPSIYRMIGPDGKSRLWVYSALKAPEGSAYAPQGAKDGGNPNRVHTSHRVCWQDGRARGWWMPRVVSEDDGRTWRELEPLGPDFQCVMTFSSVVRLKDGSYMGFFHRNPNGEDESPLSVWSTVTKDGGFTWSKPVLVASAEKEGLDPCEPLAFRGPDGNEIRLILRENRRKGCSLMTISTDEGRTWKPLRPTPWSLTGDRHQCVRLSDGRYCLTFRDMAPQSPTYGDFVAWVGPYEAISSKAAWAKARRFTLVRSHCDFKPDCGYPGLELLPDGTPLAVTYAKIASGAEQQSVVAVRVEVPVK